ncbi:MAG: exosortase-associated EpsI family protein [Chloroflexota bacterium]|nr:exosortase-associated EpsI family protein [Chloroflexota bacterium]
MRFLRQYSTIIGCFLLILAIVILLSTPEAIFSKGISVTDTELSRSGGSSRHVRTSLDFGSNDHMRQNFPLRLEDWRGTEYDTKDVADTLGADVMMMRGYIKPGVYSPIFLLIMQAVDRSSFHPPTVCYPAMGYTIEEETSDEITISDKTWAQEYGGKTSLGESMSVKKLVVSRESEEGVITERRLVLYFYVKDNPLNPFSSDTITMIRVSALIPINQSYGSIANTVKAFTADALPYMFDPDPDVKDDERLVFNLVKSGILGYLGLVGILTIPLFFILYPYLWANRREVVEQGQVDIGSDITPPVTTATSVPRTSHTKEKASSLDSTNDDTDHTVTIGPIHTDDNPKNPPIPNSHDETVAQTEESGPISPDKTTNQGKTIQRKSTKQRKNTKKKPE